MIYFVADTHFGHYRILDFERHQFEDIKEHDNYIMRCLERTIQNKDDVLYFLGDFMFGRHEDIITRFKKLPGKKIVISGNHDKMSLLEECFDEVHDFPMFISRNIMLSHEPEQCSPHVLNVHGHLHGAYLDSVNHLNVNIHMTDYKIYNLSDIEKIAAKLPHANYMFPFEWYGKDYVFIEEKEDVAIDKNGKIKYEETLKLQKNRYLSKRFIDPEGHPVCFKVKPLYKKGTTTIYVDEYNDFFIGKVHGHPPEIISPCNFILRTDTKPIKGFEKWDKCWTSGRRLIDVFPESKNKDCFVFLKLLSA